MRAADGCAGNRDCENILITAHNADYTDDYFRLGSYMYFTCVDFTMA